MEVSSDELARAVESMYGGKAVLISAVPVREEFEGKIVWEGVVHQFEIVGSEAGTRAYAWSHAIIGSTRRRFVVVLHKPPVDSPLKAVRAAIVAEQHSKGE